MSTRIAGGAYLLQQTIKGFLAVEILFRKLPDMLPYPGKIVNGASFRYHITYSIFSPKIHQAEEYLAIMAPFFRIDYSRDD